MQNTTINPDDYPWGLFDDEINYLSTLSDNERENDLYGLIDFMHLTDDLDIVIDPNNPREFDFGGASEYKLKINRIIHKHLGFDMRLADDFFFRRFTSTKIYSNVDQSSDSHISLNIDLWNEFTLDRLTPTLFEDLSKYIDLNQITQIQIFVKSICERIDSEFFLHTPNLQYFKIRTQVAINIPNQIFSNFPNFNSFTFSRKSK